MVLLLFCSFNSVGQDANDKYQECMQRISQQEEKESDDLLNNWYDDNPDPSKYVMLACDDHCPKYYCHRHHKQCAGQCDCASQYGAELNSIKSKFSALRKACESEQKESLQKQDEELQKQNESQFNSLTDEAEKLENEGKYDEAISKLNQARDLKQNTNSWIDSKVSSLEQKSKDAKKAGDDKNKDNNKKDTLSNANNQTDWQSISMLALHNQATKQNFENQKKQQQENSDEAKKEISTMGLGFASLISSGISSNNEKSFYRGHGLHLGINLGLKGTSVPFVCTSTVNSWNDDGYTMSNQVTDSSIVSKAPFGIGLTGGIDFDPILSEYIEIGGFLYGSAGLSPMFIEGGGTSSTIAGADITTSTSLGFSSLNYGLNFSIGAKPVKLLIEYSENRSHYDYSDYTTMINYLPSYTSHLNTEILATVNYVEIKKGIGLRFLSYQSKWSLDILYYMYTPVDKEKVWALSNPEHLIKLRVWKQSIFKFDATFGFNINSLSNEIKYNDRKEMNGVYLNFSLIYCKDFFGKSFFKSKEL